VYLEITVFELAKTSFARPVIGYPLSAYQKSHMTRPAREANEKKATNRLGCGKA
jgi:hypothetical protein